jgi:type IV secretion system protein VirD4
MVETILSFLNASLETIDEALDRFLNKRDLNNRSHFIPLSRIASRWNHAWSLDGSSALSRKAAQNLFVTGQSGSGKSSSVILGSLCSISRGYGSMCVLDVSGELYAAISGYLHKRGYKVVKIDFSKPEESATFNPLSWVKNLTEINQTSNLLIANSGSSSADKFWDKSSMLFLAVFIRYLVEYAEPEYRNLYNLLYLIECFAVNPQETTDKLFMKVDEDLLNSYKGLLVTSEKTLQSIVISIKVALQYANDPTIAQITGTNSIDFKDLRNRPTVIFLCTPVTKLGYYAPITSVFFQSLFNELLREIPCKNCLETWVILDEMATYRFEQGMLGTLITNCRKYKIKVACCLQDPAIMNTLFSAGEAQSIRSNCNCHIHLKGRSHNLCKELESQLGKTTVVDERGNERIVPLMTADALRLSDKAVILYGNEYPILAKMRPVFKNIWLKRFLEMPPYQPPLEELKMPPKIKFG